eukprot:10562765-Lingulodinium_polyedra.AAC.1
MHGRLYEAREHHDRVRGEQRHQGVERRQEGFVPQEHPVGKLHSADRLGELRNSDPAVLQGALKPAADPRSPTG